MLRITAISGLGEIRPGADLAGLIHAASPVTLSESHLLCLAHKAVSKAEGRVVELAGVQPGPRAIELAARLEKDPRVVEVVLGETQEVLRAERGVMICRTHSGLVCANAGVDASNADPGTLILLPTDPDASARALRARLGALTGAPGPAVLISDSFGRAWRQGQVDIAVGCAGVEPLEDWRGRRDSRGMELHATWLAVADAAAAAADLARAKDSAQPAVIIEGLARHLISEDGPGAAPLRRPIEEDLFR